MDAPDADRARTELVPGLLLLRRSRAEWQLGLDRSCAVRVPAPRDGSRPTPEALTSDPRTAHLVVCDRTDEAASVPPAEAAAVVQRDPGRAGQRLRRRATASVLVDDGLGADAGGLVAGAGIRVLDQTSGVVPDAVLLLVDGEVPREEVDRLTRVGRPHLVVRLVDGVVTLGPFVVPGRTACLRCIDAHLASEDPLHHSLVAQHAALSRLARTGRPRDHALLSLATAWAVRDLVTWVEGDRPTTWSATVRLEAGLASVTETHWLRHPECGCFWLPDQEESATLGP